MNLEFAGFFDLQVNGFAGVDFNNPAATPDEVEHAIAAMRRTGVTRFLPTLITSPLVRFVRCARNLLRTRHPAIAGLHMEGPYISPEDGARGAHPREHVSAASREDFAWRQEAAAGTIRLVTLAPEVPGAISLIEHLVTTGVCVAIGHTAATPAQIQAAIAAGASLTTHLGNGCASVLPRHPNLLWEQLASDRLRASFIVDGHHLPAATVKAMIRAKTPARSLLISDAMAAAGCPPGRYEFNGEWVVLGEDGRVSSPGTPWLAGSALGMDQAVMNAVKFTGLTLPEIIPLATSQPAAYLGDHAVGRVTADWDAARCQLTILKVRAD